MEYYIFEIMKECRPSKKRCCRKIFHHKRQIFWAHLLIEGFIGEYQVSLHEQMMRDGGYHEAS